MKNVMDTARFALQALKRTGAQQYSVQVVEHEKREFEALNGQFNMLRTTFDKALDLTLLKDHRRGKITGNDLSEQAIQQAAADCLASAQSGQADEAWQLFPGEQRAFEAGAFQGDLDRLFARAQELLDTVGKEYPKVMLEAFNVEHSATRAVYLNSLGAQYETTEGEYGVSVMFNAQEGDTTSSFNHADISTDSLDTPFIELGGIRQMFEDIQRQVHTTAPQGKYTGSVVFLPGCASDVLWYLIDSFMADGCILDGTSPWKDKLGQQVADPALTIRSAPHHERIVCGERYQSDGRLSEDYDLIRNGVLNQFALSSYVANKVGGQPAPNGGLTLVVEPGEQTLMEIIAGIDRGLLVGRFSGGNPASNGDFSGVAKNSFLIENGKIGPAVSETMISGNLAQMIKKLRGISSERVGNGSRLLPWLAVDGITISGK